MKPEDAEEYTQALGQVVAGGWRQIALGQRLGVPQALGLSVGDWVNQRLGGYVRYSIAERREAVAELRAQGLSQRAIGAVVGVTEATVNRDLMTVSNVTDESEISGDESESVRNVTPGQWADLEEVQGRAREIEQLRAEHPERFAADEIFDVLAYALDVTETWTGKIGIDAEPGTKSLNEWESLLNRLQTATEFVRRFHEHTYARQ